MVIVSKKRNRKGKYKVYKEIKIKTLTIEEILDNYLLKVILIEALDFSFNNLKNSNIYKFLMNKGYHLVAKTINTMFYINDSFNIGGLK